MRRFIFGLIGAWACLAGPLHAEPSGLREKPNKRFVAAGHHLYYDSDVAAGQSPLEIDADDLDRLKAELSRNGGVKTLVLNSGGGSLWAAEEMARIVIDYGLDTHVDGECSSACVTLFLAGETRTMARGSKIGFHQNTWSAEGMREYYKSWYGHDEGWENPFEFAEWVYHFTQTEAHDYLSYMVERGVEPGFAIRSERPVKDFWYPRRQELAAAGVLRDMATR